jgi:hypothetical protein
MPFGKSRWIDENGRSHNWSGEVASTNRNQVESQIRSQTGAKNVIIGDVYAENPANYKNKRSKNASEERERFAEQERNLRSSGSSSSSYSSGGSSYSGGGNSMDAGTAGGFVLLLGAAWAFFTFTPWILMLLYGPGSAWVTEKMTGQSIDEYNNTQNPTDSQHKKALAIVLSAIIFGGAGFIQGSNIQKDWEVESKQPKTEQVQNK